MQTYILPPFRFSSPIDFFCHFFVKMIKNSKRDNNVDKTLLYIIVSLTLPFLDFNYFLSFLQKEGRKVIGTAKAVRREYYIVQTQNSSTHFLYNINTV